MIPHRCLKCNRLLLETDGELKQIIKIRCKRCSEWNIFKPNRPEVAGQWLGPNPDEPDPPGRTWTEFECK